MCLLLHATVHHVDQAGLDLPESSLPLRAAGMEVCAIMLALCCFFRDAKFNSGEHL